MERLAVMLQLVVGGIGHQTVTTGVSGYLSSVDLYAYGWQSGASVGDRDPHGERWVAHQYRSRHWKADCITIPFQWYSVPLSPQPYFTAGTPSLFWQ